MPCDAGRCASGYACRWDDVCVPAVKIGCEGDGYCPESVQAGDPCAPVGAFLPRTSDANNCDFGCRLCQENNTWSEVAYCKLGQVSTCGSCYDNCFETMVNAIPTCEVAEGGTGFVCSYSKCNDFFGNRTPEDKSRGCPDKIMPEVCDGVDNDIDGAVDEEGAKGCVERYRDTLVDGVTVSVKSCLCERTMPFVGGDPGVCELPSEFTGLVFQVPISFDPLTGAPRYQLSRVEADGTGYKVVAKSSNQTASIESFTISPDRKWLAFLASFEPGRPTGLYTASLVNCDSVREVSSEALRDAFGVTDFKWAPDSSRLAYVGKSRLDCAKCQELYAVMPSDDGHVRLDELVWAPEVTEPMVAQDFLWSQDSRYVAFRANSAVDGLNHIYVARAEGGELAEQASSTDSSASVTMPMAWSPGGVLAFWQSAGGFEAELLLYQPQQAAPSSTPIARPTDDNEKLWLAWQPGSGDYLAFAEHKNEGEVVLLHTYRMAGENTTPATLGCLNGDERLSVRSGSIKWSPDGAQLSYLHAASENGPALLYREPPEGNKVDGCIPLTPALPSGKEVAFYDWASSATLVFGARPPWGGDATAPFELYRVAASLSDPELLAADARCTLDAKGECLPFVLAPGGDKLAFVAGTELWAAAVGAGEAELITPGTSSIRAYAFARGGAHLAYVSTMTDPEFSSLRLLATPALPPFGAAVPVSLAVSLHQEGRTAKLAWW